MYVWNKATLTADHSVIAQRLTYWPKDEHQASSLSSLAAGGVHELPDIERSKNRSLFVQLPFLSDHHRNGAPTLSSMMLQAGKADRSVNDRESRGDRQDSVARSENDDEKKLKKRSMDYCNSLQSAWIENSQEGVAPSGYRLVGVVVLTRHGDRSPMYALPNHVGPRLSCALQPTPSSKSSVEKANETVDIINQYVTAMRSVIQSKRSSAGDLFHRFGLYPTSAVCYGAQLTGDGAVQMLRLGEFLRERYISLLGSTKSSSETPRFYVRATEYPRTFQSAVALLYGLSGVDAVTSSTFEATRNIYFCSEAATNFSCACATAGRMLFVAKRNRTYSDEERKIRGEIGQIFNVSATRLPWMQAMMEVFMAYACHDVPLPCGHDSRCITWPLINQMWRLSDTEGSRNQSPLGKWSTVASTFKSAGHHQLNVLASKLLVYPLLHEIASRLLNLTKHPLEHKDAANFVIYSGHDKTLSAVLRALEVFDDQWPPYAARLIFELYDFFDRRQHRHFIRLLYNGRDLTADLPFFTTASSSQGQLCPLDDFIQFIRHRFLNDFDKSTYAEACAAH